MVDVAMDLHKRHSQVGTLDEGGEVRQFRIEHDGESRGMQAFLQGLAAGSRIAIEATGNWWWVVDLAEAQGHEVVLSNPKKTRAIAHACLKNDQVDTDQLLHLLRLGYLPRVWIPPAPLRYGKEVLRYRALLVGLRTGLKNHLGAMLTKRNLKGPGKKLWSKPGQAYLEKLELNAEAAGARRRAGEAIEDRPRCGRADGVCLSRFRGRCAPLPEWEAGGQVLWTGPAGTVERGASLSGAHHQGRGWADARAAH
jgi:hypothetical protein